jgi:hypothetical protein
MKIKITSDFINRPDFLKHNTSETGYYSTIRYKTGKVPTQLGPFESASLNYQTRCSKQNINSVNVKYHKWKIRTDKLLIKNKLQENNI